MIKPIDFIVGKSCQTIFFNRIIMILFIRIQKFMNPYTWSVQNIIGHDFKQKIARILNSVDFYKLYNYRQYDDDDDDDDYEYNSLFD